MPTSSQYSLRVPLAEDLENRLKRYADKHDRDMTDIVRDLIRGLPLSADYFDYSAFSKAHERSIRKLDFWTMGKAQEYITEMMYCDTKGRLNGFFAKMKFNHQASTLLAKLVPSHLHDMFSNEDKTLQSANYGQWYDGLPLGEYVVLEEPIVEGFTYAGETVGVVTRNAYNAKVLNADNMMIVDVDTNTDYDGSCHPASAIVDSDSDALAALKYVVAKDESLGFRVYKTANGLRYICTSKEASDIKDPWRIMQALYSDPLYIRLCKFQETYRARLTAKPWRGDENDAVCRFLGTYGANLIIEPFETMVRYHDRLTLSEYDDSPLA